MAEVPLDDDYPEVMPLRQPEQPQIGSPDSQTDSNHVVFPQFAVRKI